MKNKANRKPIKKADTRFMFMALGAVLVITILLYLPSLKFGFVTDDDPGQIINNVRVHSLSWDNIKVIFTTDVMRTYVPLTVLSHALEFHFFGLDPFYYHLDNLLLHLGVVAGIFFLILRLGFPLWVSFFSALIFAIHPMHVESVAWVTERKDVLYAFFYVLALNLYGIYADTQKKKYFILALLCALLSILSKAMALSFPLVLFVYDWFKGRSFNKALFFEKIPFFLVIVPIAWLTYSMNARVIPVDSGDPILIWIWTFVFYIQRFLFPFLLLPIYNLSKPVTLLNWHYGVAMMAFVFMLFELWFFRHKRLFIFALLYYFASIFFLLRYDDSVDVNIVADRFMYLPSLGFCILLGAGIGYLFGQARHLGRGISLLTFCTLAFLGGLLIFKTSAQIHIWGDNVLLWNGVIEHYPDEFYAYDHRGYAFGTRGEFEKAISDYSIAVGLNPKYAVGYNNRGNAYASLKKYDLASKDYEQAIKLKPLYDAPHFNQGMMLQTIGHNEEAAKSYSKAIEINPQYIEAYRDRGTAYYSLDQYEKALEDFNTVLRLDPNDIITYMNRALLFQQQNKTDQALFDAEKAIQLEPNRPEPYWARGRIYFQAQDWRKALEDFNHVLAIKPDYPQVQELRDQVLQKIKKEGK